VTGRVVARSSGAGRRTAAARARGDEAGPHAGGEHALPPPQRLLPERRIEERGGLAALFVPAPGVVDEDVEAASIGGHAREQRVHVDVDRVIAAHRHADGALRPDERRGLLERVSVATSDIDGRAGGAEFLGDAATRARLAPVTTQTDSSRFRASSISRHII
jgi:hypothetical protein